MRKMTLQKPLGPSMLSRPRISNSSAGTEESKDEYGPNAFFAQNPQMNPSQPRGRLGSTLGGHGGSQMSRRGSQMSSNMSLGGGSSLRNKISNSLKQRVDTFRRLSTIKKKAVKEPEQFDPAAMSTVNEDDDDLTTELDRVLREVPDGDLDEALNMTYDVIENATDNSPYRQACLDALAFYKKRTGDENVDP
mmetsp:Transcript_22781/g.28190  ORF Transcript_22781/g.28190 Transcript_22781/m.28190 type:complete len:192 (+) Transcript_22781:1683-2258(+)